MKKYFQFISSTVVLLSIAGASLSSSAAELMIEINNIKEVKGSLYLSVYKDAQGFDMNTNFVKREKIIVDNNILELKISDLPDGEYAVKVYQDVNNNGKMDFHGMLPTEPYASSGTGSSDKNQNIAPPNFANAKFTVEESRKIHIQLLN